jgi:hypothetical protein
MNKDTFYFSVIVLVLLFLIYRTDIETFVSRKNVCNKIDGRCYSIVGKYENMEGASDLLAYLNNFSLEVMRWLRNKYVFNDPVQPARTELVKFLLSNYNPDGIIENAPVNDINTSYVDDKGKVFAICLREKESGKNNFHNRQILEFVVLHEMTHMATYSYGHEVDFWTNFKFLLQEAKEAGLHDPIDYKYAPVVYCSLTVDYNPYFDKSLADV